jgi:mRNA-degrading endonuclease toxin of MazEF toxin-antitoxin module
MTTGSRPAPFCIMLRCDGKDGLVLLEQTCAIDRARLIRRLGRVPGAIVANMLARLGDMFADGAA